MNVLIDVPPEKLPQRFQDLLDPDKPLKEPDRFFVGYRVGGFMAWVVLVGCIICTVLFGRAAVLALSGEDSPSMLNFAFSLLLGIPLLLWGIRQVFLIRQGRRDREAIAQGRFRCGVFFEPDAALFHLEKGVCTLVPRNKIDRVGNRARKEAESGARALSTHIDFRDAEGRSCSLVAATVSYPHAASWFETGKVRPRR
ncbi:hypothetical protein [Haliangium ochraceum]|uniref:Uncharacterized protein n=1 Tax=Haliangium ochraceum (strain DSM 14365 / JCM 11303 / SMP-2) TaxID=502025 RepID=D0LRF2_HALO1|nr:hypothetical protein [Haliangium ochraceum]ACY17180.1 hypothetical protein Hoch_4689 [Haliangium ochraceum DSM 14365]